MAAASILVAPILYTRLIVSKVCSTLLISNGDATIAYALLTVSRCYTKVRLRQIDTNAIGTPRAIRENR